MTGNSTNDERGPGSATELQELLDAWGGNPQRWPPVAGQRIQTLIATTPGAQALLKEARVLDGLLAQGRDAPVRLPSKAAGALAGRIVAAAIADHVTAPSPQAAEGRVVQFPPSPRRTSAVKPASPMTIAPARQSWRAAGVMAASLIVGLVLGGSINLAPVVQELAEVAGLSTVLDPAVGDDLGEEETL